jgi:hypothetical protein
MFAGNPPNEKFIRAGKFNLAFQDRMACVRVDEFSRAEIVEILSNTKYKIDKSLMNTILDNYDVIKGAIKSQKLRAEYTMRSLKRIMLYIKAKYDPKEAIDMAFTNAVMTFDEVAGKTVDGLVKKDIEKE